MKPFVKNVKNNWTKEAKWGLITLLVLAGFLRFFHYYDWSLSNDELSALNRLNYDSLSELIQHGIAVDGHPAFVQLFLFFWTALFGDSAMALRLPFVLAGIGACWYFYLFIRDFVHEKAAELALSIVVCSQFFILYSQLARPYAMGLFFTMASAYYAFRLLNFPQKKGYWFALVISSLLGIISHYFASMSIGLFLLMGFIFLNKTNWKAYLLACLAIAVLFLPHLGISLGHLKIGGISWLPEPDEHFFFRFLEYVLNDNEAALYCVICLPLLALLAKSLNLKPYRILLLPLLFFVPYKIAMYYSLNYSPVMQFSVLLFSIPFLLAFPVSLFSKRSPWWLVHSLSFFIVVFSLFSLIGEKDFYHKKLFANFKGVAENAVRIESELGGENMLHFSNSNNSSYFNYYYEKLNFPMAYDIDRFKLPSDIGRARDLIYKSDKDYVLLSFANVPIPAEVYEFAKEKYPILVERHRYFNSELALYRRADSARAFSYKSMLSDQIEEGWANNILQPDTTFYFSPPASFEIDSAQLYALTYRNELGSVLDTANPYLSISAQIYWSGEANAKLVFSLENDSGSVFWRGIDLANFKQKESWFKMRYLYTWDKQIKLNSRLNIYFWNPEKAHFWVDDFEISNYKDSDYSYYELP